MLKRLGDAGLRTKSGVMLGLGETFDEVVETMEDLRSVGCQVVTLTVPPARPSTFRWRSLSTPTPSRSWTKSAKRWASATWKADRSFAPPTTRRSTCCKATLRFMLDFEMLSANGVHFLPRRATFWAFSRFFCCNFPSISIKPERLNP